MGGPFLPIRLGAPGAPLETAFEQLQSDLARNEKLAAALPRLPVRSPLPGRLEMTSPFGVRLDPFLGRLALHPGEDLRATVGEPVRATAEGRVTNASWDGGYGNMVEINHGDGLVTRYGHLSAIDVKVGQRVTVGQEIGHTGSTGRSTGPHLHYEVRIDGQAVDPHRFLEASRMLAER
jgi:murein DD-endopeptidase MepM/ murein hydrolase activator NlpD